MGTTIAAYIPSSMAEDLRKLGIDHTVTTRAIQKTLRKLIADKKAHIAWAEAGCPETPAEETPSLKELLNIAPDEGTMSYLVTVEQEFNAPTVAEGVQQALDELRRVFGPEAVFQTSLPSGSVSTYNGVVLGKIQAKVYLL